MVRETNPQWSRQLKGIADELLHLATCDSLGKAIDRIGPEETRKITEAITAELAERRGPSET
jgi:hypothetical protein